jgi:hypothetical protein
MAEAFGLAPVSLMPTPCEKIGDPKKHQKNIKEENQTFRKFLISFILVVTYRKFIKVFKKEIFKALLKIVMKLVIPTLQN